MPHTIAYFISPHGFGHAARAAGVMQACQSQRDDLFFDLYTTVPAWFFEQSRIANFHWFNVHSDIGVLQSTPFTEDFEATLAALACFYPPADGRMDLLAQNLLENKAELVICDIAPLGILAAKKAGIPALLVENFTWDWIYQAYLQDYAQFDDFIALLESYFARADVRIQSEPLCATAPGAHYLPHPIARCAFSTPEHTRKALGIAESESVVLISMGGIAEDFQALEQLHALPATTFLIPGGSDRLHRQANCVFLPHHSDFYHPDLIAAANAIIGKAGYSTIAEVLQAGIPFAFISRDRFREAEVLSRHIRENLPSIEITESEYRAGDWMRRIPELLTLPYSTTPHPNGAATAARIVLEMLPVYPPGHLLTGAG